MAFIDEAGLVSHTQDIKALVDDEIYTVNVAIEKADAKVVKLLLSSFSTLPITVSSSKITADHIVIASELSNPAAQASTWTVTTTSGGLTISGSISGATTLNLVLAEPTLVNVTL